MDANSTESVTVLLNRVEGGDLAAGEVLYHRVERELRAIAEKQIRDERAGHSLQATLLIDDAFLRLTNGITEVGWQNRRHFFRAAARAMRQMLVDHERARRAARRGGRVHQRVALELDRLGTEQNEIDLLALNEALDKLAKRDPRQSEIVDLHHFGGLSLKETADLLEISVGTVKSDWRLAKAWLHRELSNERTT
ncbi:ECF-type sigma factor [Aeoliella straminimaris]|uniref:ECF-type sigma factor n=1 Tax=Aeoliella straminimaris TaxID=2954799 RepID=UPI0020920407